MTRALIIVDVQNDFCEDGALAVKGGYEVAQRIRRYVLNWSDIYTTIVATQDCHQADNDNGGHFSLFPDYVDTWPVHCVEDTNGAVFAEPIEEIWNYLDDVFSKGQGKPDYSGFQGIGDATGKTLHDFLQDRSIVSVDIVGIAGDHCVKATAEDAVNYHYSVRILPDLVASVGGKEATIAAIQAVDTLS